MSKSQCDRRVVSEEAATNWIGEVHRGQIAQSSTGHGNDFVFYPKCNVKPLKVFSRGVKWPDYVFTRITPLGQQWFAVKKGNQQKTDNSKITTPRMSSFKRTTKLINP